MRKLRKDGKGNVILFGKIRFTKSSWVLLALVVGIPLFIILGGMYG